MSSERAKKKSKAPARPSTEEDQQEISVSVRFPNAIIRRAEDLANRMGQPGISVSRSGLLRVALLRGLDALEADKRGRRRSGHPSEPDEETGQLNTALRLSTSVVERIDAVAARNSQPGLTVSRSEAMRLAIVRGLDILDRERRK
jgi:predicted DNA-binding protein